MGQQNRAEWVQYGEGRNSQIAISVLEQAC